ncbi:MAG: DUF6497 family protein [Cypionkella sp.]|jgi:hypothetical protein|nr:DUF6497 family protein [Cypionkella sp.]
MSDHEPTEPGRPQAASAQDARIAVPSGQVVTLQDVIWNVPGPDGLALRFRFVAPQIARDGGTVSYEQAVQDIQHLCQTYAVPRLATFGPMPAQVIISLSDTAVAFGEAAPEATQYFESFRIQDGRCIWDLY